KQTPEITNRKIIVSARNGAEANSLKRNLETQFNTFCQKISVPICTLTVEVNACADDLQKFREETKQEDRKLALEMVQNQQKQDQSKEKLAADKPFILGYPIKDEPVQMEEILEEEQRITVQGYIFAVEERKLRSGRSLLIIKAT